MSSKQREWVVYETTLRDFTVANIESFSDTLGLGGIEKVSIEYPTKNGRIDILTVHKKNMLGVWELKVEKPLNAIGQLLFYKEELKKDMWHHEKYPNLILVTSAWKKQVKKAEDAIKAQGLPIKCFCVDKQELELFRQAGMIKDEFEAERVPIYSEYSDASKEILAKHLIVPENDPHEITSFENIKDYQQWGVSELALYKDLSISQIKARLRGMVELKKKVLISLAINRNESFL